MFLLDCRKRLAGCRGLPGEIFLRYGSAWGIMGIAPQMMRAGIFGRICAAKQGGTAKLTDDEPEREVNG